MPVSNNIKAIKSGVWYIFANFLTKGVGFLTTPFFTRLMTQEDYGLYSNYVSWLGTFTIVGLLNAGATFISARFDFKDDFDGYISSSLALSSLVTLCWAAVINLFPQSISDWTGVDVRFLNIMVLYLFFFSAIDMFQLRERYYYEYKISAGTSILIAISTALVSVILVLCWEDKLFGRVLGAAAPVIFIGALLYVLLMLRGRKIKLAYWKYALPICLPFIPHMLSLVLLGALGTILLTRYCGPEQAALYAVSCTCGSAISVLMVSLNTAFSPWLGEKLYEKDYGAIKSFSRTYILLFMALACGLLLVTPELLLIMGGQRYYEALYVMPPIAFGCVCQFLYTMFVNVEQNQRKTVGMALASMMTAAVNYGLNMLFIPKFGYMGAAYVSAASYVVLFLLHVLLVKRMGFLHLYPMRLIAWALASMALYVVLVNAIYQSNIIRYALVVSYGMAFLLVAHRKKDDILKLVGRRRQGHS